MLGQPIVGFITAIVNENILSGRKTELGLSVPLKHTKHMV